MSTGDDRLHQAAALLEAAEADAAARCLRDLLSVEPNHAEAHRLLAQCLADQRDFATAEEHARQAVQLAPDDPLTHQTQADVLMRHGQHAAALSAIERALAIAPGVAFFHGVKASIFASLEQWRDALAASERGLRIDPEDVICQTVRHRAADMLGVFAAKIANKSATADDRDPAGSVRPSYQPVVSSPAQTPAHPAKVPETQQATAAAHQPAGDGRLDATRADAPIGMTAADQPRIATTPEPPSVPKPVAKPVPLVNRLLTVGDVINRFPLWMASMALAICMLLIVGSGFVNAWGLGLGGWTVPLATCVAVICVAALQVPPLYRLALRWVPGGRAWLSDIDAALTWATAITVLLLIFVAVAVLVWPLPRAHLLVIAVLGLHALWLRLATLNTPWAPTWGIASMTLTLLALATTGWMQWEDLNPQRIEHRASSAAYESAVATWQQERELAGSALEAGLITPEEAIEKAQALESRSRQLATEKRRLEQLQGTLSRSAEWPYTMIRYLIAAAAALALVPSLLPASRGPTPERSNDDNATAKPGQ